MNRLKKYYSKVLLFGEYTVLSGGNALALPVKNLSGIWQKDSNPDISLNEILYNWCEYLSTNAPYLSTKDLKKDWQNGYRFLTNIPTGYGVGSSGVISAIIYDQYNTSNEKIELAELKEKLGTIESFFHHQSSGLDPLVSFLNEPILISTNQVSLINQDLNLQDWKVYLLDSGQKRNTADLVPLFKDKMKQSPEFVNLIETNLKKEVNNILEIIIGNEDRNLSEGFGNISLFQWENMDWLIHPSVKDLWQESLKNPDSYIKICGAGGGGYYLMFSREKNINISMPFIGPLEF